MSDSTKSTSRAIYLDSTSAQADMKKLQNAADTLKQKLDAGELSGKKLTNALTKFDEVNAKIKNVQDQLDKGLKPSLTGQISLVTKLKNELSRLSESDPRFAAKQKEYQRQSQLLEDMRTRILGVNNASKSLFGEGGGLTKIGVFFATFAAGIALKAVSAIQEGISAVFNLRVQLEKSVQNLSAITGATGKDLEFLKNAAIELSKTSSQSAVDFVEGFKLIASAKPELLSAKEDLVEVTKQALLLSQASGLELPDAATRLTDALNQFGEPAQSAAKYVDALAAAAKFGAAEVPEVTEALLKFGSLAKASNINIYESAAAIELLAEKGLKGAEAGTQLRNVFLRLSAVQTLPKPALDALEKAGVNTQILQDKTLSLETRLKELSKVQGNTNALVKIFGTENLNAGQIVLQNIPRYAELARQVQENGVASQQAATNTDTLANKWAEFKNLLSSFFLEGSNSPLKRGIEVLTVAAKGLHDMVVGLVAGFKMAYQAAEQAVLIGKDILSLDPAKAAARIGQMKAENLAAKERLETEKQMAEAQRIAQKTVEEASRKSLAAQKEELKGAIALQDASFKAYNDMITAGKKNTEEGKRLRDQLYQDTQVVNGLRKLIKDGEASAAKPVSSNDSTETGNPAAEKKAATAAKKAADDRKRLLEQYNEFVKGLNRSINETLTPEASKKFAAIIRESNDELEKLKKLAQGDEQYQKGKALILEKQRVAVHALVEEEAKLYKSAPEQVSTVDPSTITGALKNSLPKTPVKVPIEVIPEIPPEDEKAVTAALGAVLDRLQRNASAGFQLDILKAGNPGERRDALLAQLDEEHALEMQNKDLTDNEKLVKEEEYNQKRKGIVFQYQQEIVAYLQEGLQFAGQVVDILGQFAQAASNRENAALQKEIKSNEVRKKMIQDQANRRVISSQEAARQIAAIDQDMNKKKEAQEKRDFERNKKMQLAQAAINGALAITNIWATTPKVDFGVSTYIMLGLSAIATLTSLATIAAQKFAQGGLVTHPGNGKIKVASNIPTQPNGDDVLATVKRGEVILNEDQQRRLGGPNTFRSIGVPGFAGGGVIKPFWQTRPYKSIDYGRVTQSIQVLKYAEGGRVPLTPALSPRGEGGSQPDPAVLDALERTNAVNAALVETISGLSNQLASGISANVSLKKIDEATAKRNRIKSDSEMR